MSEHHDLPWERLEPWLQTHLPNFRGLQDVRKFSVGQSNPTYLLSAASGRYVLRRKPAGVLLKSAHAVDREFRVMGALAGSGIPVPEVYALCEDESVIGTTFFVMAYLEGRVFMASALPELDAEARGDLYRKTTDLLARLATLDVAALGLADFGRPGNYVARQLDRWTRQYRASETETIDAMEQLMTWLAERVPPDEGEVALVHGDFRLDNLIIHPERPRVIGVIDWELSTLGHPLVDFTYWMTMLRFPAELRFGGLGGLSRVELGIPEETELAERFLAATGLDVPQSWNFWIAFHCFRFAAILQGVGKRALDGIASSKEAREVGALARPIADLGWHIAAEA